MSTNFLSTPWRVSDSDSEDEINNRNNGHLSLPSTPPTSRTFIRQCEPRTPDWNPLIERHKRKFGHRKTAPSFEKGPSHHKPIFSGSPNLKSSSSSSSNSLFEQKKTISTNIPETPPASPLINNSNFNPIKLIQENLTEFIYTYIPKEYPSFIHCCIRRDKSGLQKEFFPTYYLHVQRPGDGKKFFLLAARKVAKINRQSEYLITTDIGTLSEKSGGDGCVGRLRSRNAASTEYILYDSGNSPNKCGYKPHHAKHGLRRELAAIIYNTNIRGSKGPKDINVVIPKLEHNIQPAEGEDTIFDRWRDARFTDLLQLRTRSPKYIDEAKAYLFQFTGDSLIRSSGRNFQIMIENEKHEEEIVMQFSRVNSDTFTCDFRYPFSAIQAFGIALSSFDGGHVRE